MIYQFEHEGIKACGDCPCCDTVSGCALGGSVESLDDIPIDCPLVAISKTEIGGCKWCEKVGKYAQFDFATYTEVDGDKEYEYAVKVNYCPNCGRRLTCPE